MLISCGYLVNNLHIFAENITNMKGHIIIKGSYSACKETIREIDEIKRYQTKSFNGELENCRVDYFYDDYDIAELDYELVKKDGLNITLEEW